MVRFDNLPSIDKTVIKWHISAVSPSRASRHLIFWLGGLMCALIPYFLPLLNPDWRAPWILPAGHFADNIIIGTRNLLLGATFGGWLGLIFSRQQAFREFRAWWKKPRTLNWIWFLLTIAIYFGQNYLLLTTFPLTGGEFASAAAGRFLTVLTVVSSFWFLTIAASSASPPRLKKLPWIVPALFPAIIAADAFGIILWKTPIRLTLNRLDESGSINLARELVAGGIGLPPAAVIALIIGGALGICGIFHLLTRVSAKFPWRHGALTLLLLTIFSWLGLNVEKGTGFLWKSRNALHQEYATYSVHLSPFTPPKGLVTYDVIFAPDQVELAPPNRPEKPDIFLIVIESTRSKSVTAETAPFLTTEFAPDCQELGTTWSTSNATHLSWYSLFHGGYPFHWREASDNYEKTKELPAAPWFKALEDLGYRSEVRAVCDFSYAVMGPSNLGAPHVVDLLKQVDDDTPFFEKTIPEREIENFKEVRDSLLVAPSSGNFQMIALDSPHFPYEWSPDFVAPFENYDPDPLFQAYPNAEDVQRVKNRYWNAIAWTDHQIGEFVGFLKEQNRYDNALIIITADHGEEFQENGSWFHCSSLEPEQTAVPIFIKWPKGTDAPAQPSASHLDLLPSLLDFLGQPPTSFAHLPGRSLLKKPKSLPTQLTLTSFCGVHGVAMAWHRGEYTATFRWDNPWSIRPPETIYLDDITGPDGSLDLRGSDEWQIALKTHFPDAVPKFFTRFEPQP